MVFFFNLQTASDAVEHILLSKLEHYSVCVVLLINGLNLISQTENKMFSINGYEFNLTDVKFGVLERSVLGPLLFLIYINNLNQALKIL